MNLQTSTSITLEILGVARLVAGTPSVQVALPLPATLGAILQELAALCPALVGAVLLPNGQGLAEGYLIGVNGRVLTDDPATPLSQGDQLILISGMAGGSV